MYSRLPGSVGADIFLGATTTVRPVFPNSRLNSLAAPTIPHHQQYQNNEQYQQQQQQQHNHQQQQQQQQYHQQAYFSSSASFTPNPGNQLISQFSDSSSSMATDFVGAATTFGNEFSAAAASAAAAAASDNSVAISGSSSSISPGVYLANAENDDDWWSNAIEEDTFDSPLAFDASENGLWNGRFVPPPPRPPFLDDSVAADGLTTCDLCTWAWQRNAYSLDGSIDPSTELGWAFTLIIVSIISALIGAIIMVVVLRCRRMKSANANGGRPQPWWCRNNRNSSSNNRSTLSVKHPADSIRRPTSNSGVWTWLGGSRRSSAGGPDQIGPPSSSPAENHYTHMDDAYSPVGVSEALYAELDRESMRSANPSYQNTAYSQCGEKYNFQQHEQDIPMVVSSAPSSAYYSDLSVTAIPGGGSNNERAYEIVGLTVMSQPLPHWENSGGSGSGSGGGGGGCGGSGGSGGGGGGGSGNSCSGSSGIGGITTSDIMTTQRRIPRLAAINETCTNTVPSDYV